MLVVVEFIFLVYVKFKIRSVDKNLNEIPLCVLKICVIAKSETISKRSYLESSIKIYRFPLEPFKGYEKTSNIINFTNIPPLCVPFPFSMK